MNFEAFIPITLFLCIVYTIKVVIDARMRSKLITSNSSQELIESMLAGEEQQRRVASLRWGIVLLAMALGFLLIEIVGWQDVTPGVIAVLLGVTGLGNLAFFALARKLPR